MNKLVLLKAIRIDVASRKIQNLFKQARAYRMECYAQETLIEADCAELEEY